MALASVFELARAIAPEPHLVEVARSAGHPCSTSYFVWSTESLAAAVTAHRVHIRRSAGGSFVDGTAAIDLDAGELAWLVEVCADWRQRRDGWGAFWPTRSPPHAFGRTIDHYQEPGKRRRVHSFARDHAASEWDGHEVVRRCRAVDVSAETRIVAEMWREDVRVGRRERVLVGVRYRGRSLRVDARRRDMVIARPRGRRGLRLLAPEEGILSALLRQRE
ncbi:MAG: hypothetical protein M5U28_03770 [Sandaracinaceae bacterium]|nr:hypothetical protein [Sandaracinaceae bacterium]